MSKPLFQSEAKCKAIDMKIIFYSHAHFYKKGFALALLVSKVRIVGTRNIACSHLISFSLLTHSSVNLKREAEPDVQQDWGSRKRFKKARHFGRFNVKIAFQVESSHAPLRFWSFSAIPCSANWKFQMTPALLLQPKIPRSPCTQDSLFSAFSACMHAAGARVSHLKGRSGSLDVFIS